MSALESIIQASLPELIEIRHDFHIHPELGFEETRTSGKVQSRLKSLGIDFVAGLARGTGVLGYLPATTKDPKSARTVALRADMDALPVHEETGKPYASQTPGKMHACGHDGHTTILLGTAEALTKVERDQNVVLVFQPAEEGGAGGDLLCKEGALDGRIIGQPVDVIYGLHGFPTGRLGTVSTRPGPLMASATEIEIDVVGKGTHAAYPHKGVDTVVVASHIIVALQSIVARSVDPLQSLVITIGKLHAGHAHNIIPERAQMRGTLRALSDEMATLGKRRVTETVEHVAKAFGATATVKWTGHYPVVVNDADATARFQTIAREIIGSENVLEEESPSMGGEDFSFYGKIVPACFYFLGLLPEGQTTYPNLHAPTFDFNDDAIPTGIRLMAELALKG